MIESAAPPSDEQADAVLRDALAQSDTLLQSAVPIMRHLLAAEHDAAFADEIVARVRGGVTDIARQLLAAAGDGGPDARAVEDEAALGDLVDALVQLPGVIGHLHALALEWQLAERLRSRHALDPALPPLLEALIASEDGTTAALAMNLLAAQARFAQTQRRMQLPLHELPADLLHGALVALRTFAEADGKAQGVAAEAAETAIREDYDESRTRLGLTARLVTGMGGGAVAALSLTHAGVAIFASALAIASGEDRDAVLISTADRHAARFGLALRAAGLKHSAIEEQMLILRPAAPVAVDWDRLSGDRAAAILAIATPHRQPEL